jgi:hypothetical protein
MEVYDLRNKTNVFNSTKKPKEDDLQKIPQKVVKLKPNSSVNFNITSSSSSVAQKMKRKSGGKIYF